MKAARKIPTAVIQFQQSRNAHSMSRNLTVFSRSANLALEKSKNILPSIRYFSTTNFLQAISEDKEQNSIPFTLKKESGDCEGIVIGQLNNPKSKNAISRNLLNILNKAVDELRFDQKARVLIVKSTVDGVFCAGADLKERKGLSEEEVRAYSDTLRQLMNDISNLPIPVIAAIDGHALGGGLELALACDIRIASPNSKLGLPETRWAIIPGAGGTQRLPRLVGIAKAKELIMTGKVLSGKEALDLGIVNQIDDRPFDKAMNMAKEILKKGPIAIRAAKIAINQGSQVEINSAMAIEKLCYAQTLPTKDRIEGLAAFSEKRDPIYRGE
ncbi:enoyl-CoA hydratase/isomerase domain-containing protein [Ditylenchus destructor]|uniref:Enoyl-CoA hydratase/isomerase domain-containing protein n=1 Tax=Ditylenchus destructor TaxID=166010 RepID=A0AAD4RCA2_9BILA|nr:enoyl-CoA hydratase/isomerase domain-containing protein [Ditylenchus destructor]